jgi:hypothetical protein
VFEGTHACTHKDLNIHKCMWYISNFYTLSPNQIQHSLLTNSFLVYQPKSWVSWRYDWILISNTCWIELNHTAWLFLLFTTTMWSDLQIQTNLLKEFKKYSLNYPGIVARFLCTVASITVFPYPISSKNRNSFFSPITKFDATFGKTICDVWLTY